ncbi:DUF6083 domain-containing protein [Streptomyces sanglieri]|uniref:DUF6083 domain-containing protein n=1 Tax=Streptomyces sanglieri TaxID=193460 RepID=A0ABW2XCP8_9ACTN
MGRHKPRGTPAGAPAAPAPPGTAGSRPTGPDGPSGPCEAWGTPRTPQTVRTAPTAHSRPPSKAQPPRRHPHRPGPHCGLPQDRYRTLYDGHWVLLEPRIVVPAHTIPPRRRWIITTDGTAMNLWDAEPLPGTRCRIAHRMVCPYLPRDDLWPWTTALRQENERRAQRLFNLPDGWALPDAG